MKNLPHTSEKPVLYFFVFLLFFLGSCDSGLFNDDDDMTEEEYLANCKAAIETAPEVTEFYYKNEDNPLHDSRNGGYSSLLVRKKDHVWRVLIVPTIDADPELFPDPDYVDSFTDSLFLDTSTLPVDNSDPEDEYWRVDISFPAASISIAYEVFYQCEDGALSDPTVFELQTPDICDIHPLWEVWYESAGMAGNTYKDQKTIEWTVSFRPSGSSYSMAFFPYDKLSSKAYITSGAYTYVYENFLHDFRVPDNTQQGATLPEFINQLSLKIDLHKLTGISEDQWSTWPDQVTIEGEIQVCNEDFLARSYETTARFHITWWNPY